MTILVTGGAGYIGSHIAYALIDRGQEVVVLDNLSTGIRGHVPEDALFYECDISDYKVVQLVMRDYDIDTVIHLAGSIVVPESVTNPLKYYENNVVASHSLIKSCVKGGIKNFIFSSTATVYDSNNTLTLSENSLKAPISPYARSKLMTEWMLEDASKAYGMRHMILRYFNVCGADPLGRTGQVSPVATHLIKRAAMVALGRLPYLDIFGTDYDTIDGTCFRDYIHVSDLAAAHLVALDGMQNGVGHTSYNCGYGIGLSVREIVSAFERVTGKVMPVKEGPRRMGDPPILIANSDRLKSQGWKPKYNNIDKIVRSAIEWERKLNN